MALTRRVAAIALVGGALEMPGRSQFPSAPFPDDPQQPDSHRPGLPNPDEDTKLPNGKSQKDLIAAHDHAEALKDAQKLVDLATEIQKDLQKAGSFVVPLTTMRKTEEIDRITKRIRGRLRS